MIKDKAQLDKWIEKTHPYKTYFEFSSPEREAIHWLLKELRDNACSVPHAVEDELSNFTSPARDIVSGAATRKDAGLDSLSGNDQCKSGEHAPSVPGPSAQAPSPLDRFYIPPVDYLFEQWLSDNQSALRTIYYERDGEEEVTEVRINFCLGHNHYKPNSVLIKALNQLLGVKQS